MEAAVSDILRSRKQEPGGLRKTAAISFAAHALIFAVLALVPGVMPATAERPRVVMSISLGGAPGPKTGGTQMLGGRNIQAAVPSAAPEVLRNPPPSVTPPKMTLPDPRQQKPRTPTTKPAPSSKDPKGTATGRGFETQTGTARVDTGAKGRGFGLSSGGMGGDGGVQVDVNFCCPEYLIDLRDRIRRNWNERQSAAGQVVMRFVIQRNGQLTDIEVYTSSGNAVLDLTAQRALVNTKAVAPLPAGYTERELPVRLRFDYIRN